MVTQPTALSAENIMATDNAVSALGKICEHQRDSIDGSQASVSFIVVSICTFGRDELLHSKKHKNYFPQFTLVPCHYKP